MPTWAFRFVPKSERNKINQSRHENGKMNLNNVNEINED